MLGLVQAVTAYEELAIAGRAAVTEQVALRALLANPLVRQWESPVDVLDALLEENASHLPQFARA